MSITNDIDVLMKSMMNLDMSLSEGSTGKIFGHVMDETLLDGPWNIQIPSQSMSYEGNPGAAGTESVLGGTTTSTVGKRSRSGKSRKVG